MSKHFFQKRSAFTLIELMVVVAIVGTLMAAGAVAFTNLGRKVRDTKRLSDIRDIQLALSNYFDMYGRYPDNSENDCAGWDTAVNDDNFISPLQTEGFIVRTPTDPSDKDACGGYRYYRYSGGYGCDASRGAFYVLGIVNLENSGRPHPSSPGWSCSSRNWQDEHDWVVGAYER